MASELKFDELNKLNDFFEAMEVDNNRKKNREAFAEFLFDFFLLATDITKRDIAKANYDAIAIENELAKRLTDSLEEYGVDFDKYPDIPNYALRTAGEFVATAEKELQKAEQSESTDSKNPEKTKKDVPQKERNRALTYSENFALGVYNYIELQDAIRNGYSQKEWVAIQDERTRIAHYLISGTKIPLDEYFDVGGEMMLYPHDMNASAGNVVNCRCSLIYHKGKGTSVHDDKTEETLLPYDLQMFAEMTDDEKTLAKRLLESYKAWAEKLLPSERKAISKYTYNGEEKKPKFYERLNRMLREGVIKENPVMERYSEEISSGLKKFELKEDIVCYRGMNINPFVGASKNVIYEFDAFTSTSISLSGVINNTFVIEIHVPKGARGAYIKQLSKFKSQEEFLLDKNTKYMISSVKEDNAIIEVIL